jgi:amicoumacin kinase
MSSTSSTGSSDNESGSREKAPREPVDHELIETAALWHAAPESLTHVRQGAHSVYELRAAGSRFFLRITSGLHRSREQIDAELEFLEFLASRGIAVARPQVSLRGEWIETLRAKPERYAVLFGAAPGRHFEFFSADIDRELFHRWGSAMGALHAASRDFVPSRSKRPAWSVQDTTRCDPQEIPFAEHEARREHEWLTRWLEAIPVTTESWGLIHGDFERTNFVLDEGGALRVYDFDDACYHWYVADIANALWVFRNAPPSDRAQFLTWFLKGYRERSTIDLDVRQQLSGFVRLRTLSLFINRLSSTRDAPWVRRTRAEFGAPFSW